MLEGDTRNRRIFIIFHASNRANQTRVTLLQDSSDVVRIREVSKGVRRMPRLPEARKDVTSCEKPGVAANEL